MRAPADSMKPITGTRARPARRSTSTIVSRVRLAERAAGERGVLRVAVHLAAVDARVRREHAVARPARARPCAASAPACAAAAASRDRRATSSRSSGVRRSSGRSDASGERVMRPPGTAPRCGRRSRTSSTARAAPAAARRARSGRARAGHVVEVEALLALCEPERRRRDAVAQREQRGDGLDRARGAEQMPDRGLGRGDRDAGWRARRARA